MEEEWRPVIGYGGLYSVSNYGLVRRDQGFYNSAGPRPVTRYVGRGGYWNVHLWKENKMSTFNLHSLVAGAFIGPRPEGHQVNHKDGDKLNPRSDNLEYVTPSGNSLHAFTMGLRWAVNKGARKPLCYKGHAKRLTPKGQWYCLVCHNDIQRRRRGYYGSQCRG